MRAISRAEAPIAIEGDGGVAAAVAAVVSPPARVLAAASALVVVVLLVLASTAMAVEQKLLAGDGAAGDQLGTSVAIDGDTAVVGAPRDDEAKGAVYLFTRAGDAWTETAKVTASDGAPNDELGTSVAIDGDTIVAGAFSDDVGANANQGSAYTFARTGAAARTETAKLTAADGAANDRLGESVAIEGDAIVASARTDDVGANANQGSAYTFARTGAAARTETAKLIASDGAAGDELGLSVAIEGDAIVAGAFSDDVGANADQGSAYTFARTGAALRTETAKLTASDGAAGDFLGISVAIDGDAVVAGAPGDDVGANSLQGSAYAFARSGAAARTETAKLTASDGAAFDILAASVAIDGDAIVAGASGDDVGANADRGSAYTFARTGAAARTETAKLTAADGAAGDELGRSVAIEDDAIVAGAPFDDVGANADQGSASVFFEPAPAPSPQPQPPPPPPPPSDPLTLELKAKRAQQLEKLKVKATCSNACELSARAKGKAQKRFRSKRTERELAEDEATRVRLRIPKSKLRRIGDEKGKAKIKVSATDAFGQNATDRVKVRIKP